MAYVDTKGRPSGASISGALLINGLIVTGIIFAVPDIVPERFNPTKIFTIPLHIPPRDPIKPAKPDPKHRAAKPSPTQQSLPQDLPESSRSSEAATDFAAPGDLSGQGSASTIETTITMKPVFRPAQVNPRFTNALQPGYPPGMIREEREGVVTVRILIGTDGRVKALESIRADDPTFLEATRKQAISKWRFLPATRDGKPTDSWREMTVRFQLPD